MTMKRDTSCILGRVIQGMRLKMENPSTSSAEKNEKKNLKGKEGNLVDLQSSKMTKDSL